MNGLYDHVFRRLNYLMNHEISGIDFQQTMFNNLYQPKGLEQ